MRVLVTFIAAVSAAFLATTVAAAQDCPSSVTINISSIGYSGLFVVELRRGSRPGSQIANSTLMENSGQFTFYDVCPDTYFFAIGPQDSDNVSVTSYFDVTYDGQSYNNPEVTVYYTSESSDGQQVGSARKSDL